MTTYTALAAYVGAPRAVRAVASAVGKNPHAPKVPCHRVVRSDGTVGRYSAGGGTREKERLLTCEGVDIKNGRIENFQKTFFDLNSRT